MNKKFSAAYLISFTLLTTSCAHLPNHKTIMKDHSFIYECRSKEHDRYACYDMILDKKEISSGKSSAEIIKKSIQQSIEKIQPIHSHLKALNSMATSNEAFKRNSSDTTFINQKILLENIKNEFPKLANQTESLSSNTEQKLKKFLYLKEIYSGTDAEFDYALESSITEINELRKVLSEIELEINIFNKASGEIDIELSKVTARDTQIAKQEAAYQQAIEILERRCTIENMTCREYRRAYNTTTTEESNEIAENLIGLLALELAINQNSKKLSPEIKNLSPERLKSLQNAVAEKIVNQFYLKNIQPHKMCVQINNISMAHDINLSFHEMAADPETLKKIFAKFITIDHQKTKWKPTYSKVNSVYCKYDDYEISKSETTKIAKSRGMKGYIDNLKALTSSTILPYEFINYLVYVDDQSDYVVTQSFGNKVLASSFKDKTPIIIDFGKSAPLSEGSTLEGSYLKLIKIAPYTTVYGAQRNAFFFSIVDDIE